jgi:SAM-dependent methyltransferase
VKDVAARARLIRYRPAPYSPERWAKSYRGGEWDYLGDLGELPRYSVLIGYLLHFGIPAELLDVGCGEGVFRTRIDPLPFTRYVGVDPTAEAIERARRLEDTRTSFVLGDVLEVDVGGPFDAVILNEVLYMVADPEAVVERTVALVRPGGLVLTSIWRHAGDDHLWRLLDRRLRRLDRVEVRNRANPSALLGWRMGCYRLPTP